MKSNTIVFISYAKEDIDVATRLYNDLKRAGLKPWVDVNDLLPGQRWREVISRTIKNSSYFLLLISSHSIVSTLFISYMFLLFHHLIQTVILHFSSLNK